MLVHPTSLPLPAKTLVRDLISYSGSPGKDNLSPYPGMLQILRDQTRLRGVSMDLEHLLSELDRQIDYDSRKQRPTPGFYQKREPGDLPEVYLTRLEDIDVSWIMQYVNNILTGYKHRNGGLGAQKYMSGNNGVWRDSDGEVRQITELMVDEDASYGHDIAAAKAKLPYLLKRLHQKSRVLRCSLISMYGRYLCVQRVLNRASPKPQDMLAVKIWQMDALGNITQPYPPSANHNKGFPEAFAFVRGDNPDDPYYRDLVEFGHVCDVLSIKLWMEDATKFDNKFINGLLVTYIMSNNDFLFAGRKVDTTVLKAISSTSVSDWQSTASAAKVKDEDAFVERCSTYRWLDTLEEVDFDTVKQFLNFYRAHTKDGTFTTTRNRLHTYMGFVCAPGGDTPFLFDTTSFYTKKGGRAILHKSGTLIAYTEDADIPAIHIEQAISYMRQYFSISLKHYYPEGWGQWNTLGTLMQHY